MESNRRYYERRASEELRAAARAVTPEARERRRALAEQFARKAAEHRLAGAAALEIGMSGVPGLEATAC
jgi:putative protein kinase ArgK-like GTPase of G3E family